MSTTGMHTQDTFELTSAEWQKIREFCEHGQQITKPSKFGYHCRRLTVENNDTLSWQTKSIPLSSIHRLNIGNPPKKLFRKTDAAKTSLWITIDAKDRSVSFLYHDIKSRNFWLKAITIYMSKLPKPSYIKSMSELQSALNLDQNSNYSTTQIHFSHDGNVKPIFQSYASEIYIPNIEHEKTDEIDQDPTPNISASNTPKTSIKFDDPQNLNDSKVDGNEISKSGTSTLTNTESMNVDYADILEQRKQDVFRDSVSNKNTHKQRVVDAPSLLTTRSPSDTHFDNMDTWTSTHFNTLSSIRNGDVPLIDVEEVDKVPDMEEIKKNANKLYVLTNNDENVKAIKNSDGLYNVCILNITLLVPTNDEEMNIEMIETEMDEIYSKLYGKPMSSKFDCIVLPKLEIFALDLKQSCSEIFEYLQQKFQWLIQQIKIKNDILLSNPNTKPTSPRSIVSPAFPQNQAMQTKPAPIMIPAAKEKGPSTEQLQKPVSNKSTQSNESDESNASNESNESNQSNLRKRNKSRSRTISRDISRPPIPKKLLHSLGVESLSKLTITLMRNGEKFKMYYENGSSIICKVFLNSASNGLIGDDLAIAFSNIVALYAGKHDEYVNANPSASFMIEYRLDDELTKCILLEIIHKEKYLARRNWWINSIISCVATNKPHRVPPSISSISKLLSAVTDDTKLIKLPFVDINDIEDSFSTSISFDTMDSTNDISMDAETARRKAVQRVRKYKRLQRDIQNMTLKTKTKMQNKLNEISSTVHMDTISLDNQPINNQPIQTSNRVMTVPVNTKLDNYTTDQTVPQPIPTVSDINDDMMDHTKDPTVASPKIRTVSDRNDDSMDNHTTEQMMAVPIHTVSDKTDVSVDYNDGSTTIDEVEFKSPISYQSPVNDLPSHDNDDSIRFASGEDAAKMRSTIINLTQKLHYMEQLQNTQAEKMQQFVEKETKVIKRYENEIKRLRKQNKVLEHSNKQLEFKVQGMQKDRSQIEKQIKLQQWDKYKVEQHKHKKLKSVMNKMSEDMEGLYAKLEKAENGYNAAVQNYNREKKQRERVQREYESLEQQYVCDTQQIKEELMEVTKKNNEISRRSKKLKQSLSHSEQNENKFHELLKNEIERANGLESQVTQLYKQLNAAEQYQKKYEVAQNELQSKQSETEKISETFEAFNTMNEQNQNLHRENHSLKSRVKELQALYDVRGRKLKESKQEIKRLNVEMETLSVEMKEKEKLYQKKLIDFTQYAQQQMSVQQQTLMDKMTEK